MSKHKEETLKNIRKRLETSDNKKWKTLTEEEKDVVVTTYYQIRDTDYQNINFLLREHAEEKKQFIFLVLGIFMGVFANPISSIALKYLPSGTVWHDIGILMLSIIFLVIIVRIFFNESSRSLGEENIIERLLEIGALNAVPLEKKSVQNLPVAEDELSTP
jgi:hypothetical protein